MSGPQASPEERIRAFVEAIDEELVVPARHYLRGLRRGLLVGIVLGLLLAPRPGRESRTRILAVWRTLARRRSAQP